MEPGWFDALVFGMVCLGGGGVLLSLWLGFASPSASLESRIMEGLLGLMALAAGLFAGTALVCGQPVALWGSAATLAALFFALVIVPSPRFIQFVAVCLAQARGRRCRFTTMVALWLFCPLFALHLVLLQFNPAEMLSAQELADMVGRTEGDVWPEPNPDCPLTTDRGRAIPTFNMGSQHASVTPARLASQARLLSQCRLSEEVIYLPLGWQNTNCHGFVFTGGNQLAAVG